MQVIILDFLEDNKEWKIFPTDHGNLLGEAVASGSQAMVHQSEESQLFGFQLLHQCVWLCVWMRSSVKYFE